MKFWWQNWVSSKEKDLAEIRQRYTAYSSRHGEILEDSTVPLTAEDYETVKARKARFSKIWLICFGVLLVIILFSVTFYRKETEDVSYVYMIILVAIALGSRLIAIRQYDKTLTLQTKRVIKGVITRKQMVKNEGCFVEFSLKLYIQILPDDYKILTLGDIARMEMLSDDVYIKRKVVVEGKI